MCSNLDDFSDPYFWEALDALLKARRPKERIPGWRARVLITKAKVMAWFDPQEADLLRSMARIDARKQGEEDAHDARSRPPLMFFRERYLLWAWRTGYDDEIRSQVIWGCRKWHDGSGNPCPIHG
jgi:hypothetical protein